MPMEHWITGCWSQEYRSVAVDEVFDGDAEGASFFGFLQPDQELQNFQALTRHVAFKELLHEELQVADPSAAREYMEEYALSAARSRHCLIRQHRSSCFELLLNVHQAGRCRCRRTGLQKGPRHWLLEGVQNVNSCNSVCQILDELRVLKLRQQCLENSTKCGPRNGFRQNTRTELVLEVLQVRVRKVNN
eukprot:s462_g83.t1